MPGFGAQWAAQYPSMPTQPLGFPQGMYGMPPGYPMHPQPAYGGLPWMSAHQGMMYPWLFGLHANGVPSMSTVNPVVNNAPAPAVNVAKPTPAVSQAPASGSGSAPPSSTSRPGVVLVNADDDDDSEESDDDDTSGSESEKDSEEEVEVEHGDVDIESQRST